MKYIFGATTVALLLVHGSVVSAAVAKPNPATVEIGRDLQTSAVIALSEPAPPGNIVLTLTSADPGRLLISTAPDVKGSASIKLTLRERYRQSPEFWLQALTDSGSVSYTVSAPGYESGTGTVTLTPSGVGMMGPFGAGAPGFTTTPRGLPPKVTVRAMRLDTEGHPAEHQFVRGGHSLDVELSSSAAPVGSFSQARVSIPAASDAAYTEFRANGVGNTVLTLAQPPGFRTPAEMASLSVTVRAPGLGVIDDTTIGQNLQVGGVLNLGEPAPEGGVDVNLKSDDPTKLLIASGPADEGRPSLTVKIPSGGRNAHYYLQALGKSGSVTHTASANGYLSRTGTLILAPSGVIIGPETHGPPDEAELLRPESAGGHPTVMTTKLSEGRPAPLTLYTAFLDPVTRRCADITVQQLRAGLELNVDLKNTNPAVGKVDSRVRIKGGVDRTSTMFTPLSAGETKITVSAPSGFAAPSNFTEVLVVVQQ